jgi:ATP synthase, F0 subunit b
MEGINIIDIAIYIFNFLVTFVLLYLLLYKPVSKFLGERKDRIANSLNEADEMRKEAEAALYEAKEELASTGEKARQLSHETIENAALDAERILDNAHDEAHELRMRARAQMEAERQAALERAFTELVSLAGGLASRILSREVSIDDNREIVDNFFSEETGKFSSNKIFTSGNEAAGMRSNNHERV